MIYMKDLIWFEQQIWCPFTSVNIPHQNISITVQTSSYPLINLPIYFLSFFCKSTLICYCVEHYTGKGIKKYKTTEDKSMYFPNDIAQITSSVD